MISLVVFTDDVDSEFLTESMRNGSQVAKELNGDTYDDLEFVRIALETLWTESSAVDECPVGALDVLDEDLHANVNIMYFVRGVIATHFSVLLPDPSMLSTQDLGVKKPLFSAGMVWTLVCLPILIHWLLVRLTCLTKSRRSAVIKECG